MRGPSMGKEENVQCFAACCSPTMSMSKYGGWGALRCTQGISNNLIVVFSFHCEMTTKAKFISLRERKWQLSCLIVFFLSPFIQNWSVIF